MTVVIRPAPGVFRRTMPLVVTFGLFRRYDQDPPLDETDVEMMRRVVSLARRYRIPLAYSRIIDHAKNPSPGFWLPECRPKVTDRMFEHGPGTLFQNREFSNVFVGITDRRILFAGPRNDSSLTASVTDPLARFRPVQVITSDSMLQICSASARDVTKATDGAPNRAKPQAISLSDWEYSMRQVETV